MSPEQRYSLRDHQRRSVREPARPCDGHRRRQGCMRQANQSDGTARARGLLCESMRYRLPTTIDDGASALTRIQNEIRNLKATSKLSEDMMIEALLVSLGPEY